MGERELRDAAGASQRVCGLEASEAEQEAESLGLEEGSPDSAKHDRICPERIFLNEKVVEKIVPYEPTSPAS